MKQGGECRYDFPRGSGKRASKSSGVLGVRVLIEQGRIAAVHALVGANRHPKQVVRDIESVVTVHLGAPIDRRCISVAQIDHEPGEESNRLVLDTVQMKTQGDRAEFVIELTYAGRRYIGHSSGRNVVRHRLRMVGLATLQAAEQAIHRKADFSIEDVTSLQFGAERVVIVNVWLLFLFPFFQRRSMNISSGLHMFGATRSKPLLVQRYQP